MLTLAIATILHYFGIFTFHSVHYFGGLLAECLINMWISDMKKRIGGEND